jgi:hypothetical protein
MIVRFWPVLMSPNYFIKRTTTKIIRHAIRAGDSLQRYSYEVTVGCLCLYININAFPSLRDPKQCIKQYLLLMQF